MPVDTRFVADFLDKAEMSLNYSAIFDRTDKSNTPFESVRGLILFVYTHNNKLNFVLLKNKENKQGALSAFSVSANCF